MIDPYLFCDDALPTSQYPLVEYGDIYNYLIDAPSPHTKEQLKAYKSLQGYQFCLAGWVPVEDFRAFSAGSDGRVVPLAKVRHSQSRLFESATMGGSRQEWHSYLCSLYVQRRTW